MTCPRENHQTEGGAILTEFALMLPAYILVLGFMMAVGQWQWAKAELDHLAFGAARVCAVDRPAGGASLQACVRAVADRNPLGAFLCRPGSLQLDATPRLSPAETVRGQSLRVDASCTASLVFGGFGANPSISTIRSAASVPLNPP